MELLRLTLETPELNLALDEALLERAEQAAQPYEVLRLWESPQICTILGKSSKVKEEVDQETCEQHGISIHRRSSGGAAIVIGPGCLMYAVVLHYRKRPEAQVISQAHRLVMRTMMDALTPLAPDVEFLGTCDLTWRRKKFSGNSLRCRKNSLLYHGSLLYHFPLEKIEQCLKTPPRQPEYRANRHHRDFVANLPVSAEDLQTALIGAWGAENPAKDWPKERTEQLAAEKYSDSGWNFRL